MSGASLQHGCEWCASLLEAFFDGELSDPAEAARVNRHLQDCPSCRADLDALESLSRGLRALPVSAAPDALRESVRSRLLPSGGRFPRQEAFVRVMNHPALALATAVLAGLIIGTSWQLYAGRRAEEALSAARGSAVPALDEHISLVLSDDGSALQTSNAAELEDWFRQRLDFAPPVPAWPWAELVGGRLSLIGGKRAARIEYLAGERQFTLFVQFVGAEVHTSLRKCDSGRRALITQQRGYKAAYWSRDGFTYVLVAHQTADPVFENLRKQP